VIVRITCHAYGRFLGGATLALGAAAITGLLTVSAQDTPSQNTFAGHVTITTSPERWGAVSVAPQPGAPLSAAFILQYQHSPSSLLEYEGRATVTVEQDSLTVKASDRG
jgi:hypothetical protein